MVSSAFHEVRFPLAVAFGATAGPERRTDIVLLGSGHEQRNSRWAASRRRYDLGAGLRTRGDLDLLIHFFEERRGRLYGFRLTDPLDSSSCAPGATISPLDQDIGTGDGTTTTVQLVKRYGSTFAPVVRPIVKPIEASVRVAVDGVELASGSAFQTDTTTGVITLLSGPPPAGARITAGFRFDTPVRFDTDRLEINLSTFEAGIVPSIPAVEIRP